MAERTTHYTSNHTEIRSWAKRHGARPGIARDTIASRDLDQLTLVLPGERGEENVEFIDWDEFFRRFDEEEMVFVYEERKAPRKRVKPPRVHLLIPSRIILERQRAIAAARPKPKPFPDVRPRDLAGRTRLVPSLTAAGRASRRGRATMDALSERAPAARIRSRRASKRRAGGRGRNTRSRSSRPR